MADGGEAKEAQGGTDAETSKTVKELMEGHSSDGDGSSSNDDDDDLFGEEDDEEEDGKEKKESKKEEPKKSKLTIDKLDESDDEPEMTLDDFNKVSAATAASAGKERASPQKSKKKGTFNTALDSSDEEDEREEKKRDGEDMEVDDNGDLVRARRPIEFPKAIKLPQGNMLKPTEELRLGKFPKFLHLESRCYDANMYSERRELARLAAIGKGYVGENVIRWRYKKDKTGQPVVDKENRREIESNSRIVQWSDGSMQLLVGDEVFDVLFNELSNQFVFAMTTDEGLGRHCLEGRGMMRQVLKFRPPSLSSAAHREMELKVKAKMLKSVKLKEVTIDKDPEREQDERERAVNERLRLQQRQRARNSAKKSRRPGLSEEYLNQGAYDDDDEDAPRGSMAKAKDKVFGRDESEEEESFSDSDSDSDDEEENRRRKAQAKKPARAKASDSDSNAGSESSFGNEKKGASGASKRKLDEEGPGAAAADTSVAASSGIKRTKVIDSDSDSD